MMRRYEEGSGTIINISRIKRKDIWTIRLLIACGLTLMILFICWFVKPDHIGYQPIYWLLTIALVFKLVKMLHEWYHYWNPCIPDPAVLKTKFTADILTTACPGEPKEMIIRTLKAMTAIRYPHTNYLCDEGDDPVLKKVCAELGVVHVTRTDKTDAKAGNINNALKQATGDICVVLDPDHVPVPEFLDRTIPYFEDPEIGYVQCVQAYSNQSESIIAKGAAEQTYHFYGPMMMCMNSYGTVQAIGANCTFRREALNSIGGHAAGLSEDMHTAMQIHAKGWKSIYIPEILTRGLVPATLSSYYKQQLKWARGTFELLFRVYPKLFKDFSWRQKIHYFTIPLYFLFGFINLIDILIPLLALSLAQVPWEVDLKDFGMFFLPLCGLSMVIRLFAQRWLLEKHERGFHLAGGILRTATWWIFLIGLIYSVFNIKVPYIPTPKEDEHQNYLKLSIPNFLIVLFCGVGVAYGLTIDWSPYSLAMAFYALVNAGILGFIVLMSQQHFLESTLKRIRSIYMLASFHTHAAIFASKAQHVIYGLLRNGPVALLIGSALLFFSYNNIDSEQNQTNLTKQKDFGGFFSGIVMDGNIDKEKIKHLNQLFNNNFEVITLKEEWNSTKTLDNLPGLKTLNVIPLINWEPSLFNNEAWAQVHSGKHNEYLEIFAAKLRAYQDPVFISFAPGCDQKGKTDTETNSPQEFIKAWQHIYTFLHQLGVSNITWIWSPKDPSAISFYPGTKFVDWIGVSCLNYGNATEDDDRFSFSQLYTPFRNKLGSFQKPFMITELGSPKDEDQVTWYTEAFKNIKEKYREIRAVILFDQKKITSYDSIQYTTDFNIDDEIVKKSIKKYFSEPPFNRDVFYPSYQAPEIKQEYQSGFVSGDPGNFTLLIKGKPFYIKGIAYNTAHDWRDGNMPLTRRQVEKDMQKIKEMGANTIRRYDHGIYDRNVLNIAGEYGLNVLYGFWFDPAIDYYKDSLKVQEYMENVEEKVLEFKDHSSLIAWSLGNETWGLLKHNYSKPYLTKVRQSYLQMIEVLAKKIHAIDPSHPVFSSIEHEEYQLPGELAAFHDVVPSLDAIGVNSYYQKQISRLNHVFYQFDTKRPYFISEFGPRGYWDPKYNRTSRELLVEDSEAEKALWYTEQWKNYVAAYNGYNVGGIAYCWHDRMEGSNTWFGLTDYKGRTKLSYYALKEIWTGQTKQPLPVFSIHVPHTIKPGMSYVFSAFTSGIPNGDLHYEWALHKDNYLEKVDALNYDESKPDVSVKIPEISSDYRLYLYVSDEYGNVSTASVPIKVY
jgi:cellulose synthase (UDP-forming)